jgi:DNA-binding CsgD family transcriptional regulator
MSKNVLLQKAAMDFSDILCQFQFAHHECFAVKLPENADSSINANSLWSELCRFTVNDCECAIMMKVPEPETESANLGIILTARELQIATLVASGCPNKQVADKLHISEWTVATYLRRIFAKLGVDTRAAMTYRCASLICRQNVVLSK